ncbi:hypothetical protein Hanom_Chr07g00584551 [Helianthus anomalus]
MIHLTRNQIAKFQDGMFQPKPFLRITRFDMLPEPLTFYIILTTKKKLQGLDQVQKLENNG